MLRAQHWIPSANSYYDDYEYDNLNRLTKVTEGGNASFVQAFDYDQWGNRTINQSLTTTSADINKKLFTVNTANNRLGVPSGQSGAMSYDNVGNLVSNTYTNPSAGGAMEYDAENHMTSAVNGSHQYRYNADGKRLRIYDRISDFTLLARRALAHNWRRRVGSNEGNSGEIGGTRVIERGEAASDFVASLCCKIHLTPANYF